MLAAAVRPDGSAAADVDKLSITLERQQWIYTVRQYSTHLEPYWTGKYEAVETREVDLRDGQATAELVDGQDAN